MSVTRFNRVNLREVRDCLETALATVREETGLSIDLGSCRFGSNSATFKLEVKTLDEDGKAFDESAANFKVFARDFGLEPDDLGKTFMSGLVEFTVSGLKPRNTKYPVIATRADGKTFKFSELTVQHYLNGGVL